GPAPPTPALNDDQPVTRRCENCDWLPRPGSRGPAHLPDMPIVSGAAFREAERVLIERLRLVLPASASCLGDSSFGCHARRSACSRLAPSSSSGQCSAVPTRTMSTLPTPT